MTGNRAIATEAEAAAIGGVEGILPSNRCCTMNKALSLHCVVSGRYGSNQLVKYSDLSSRSSG